MNKTTSVTALFALLSISSSAFAHDAKLHKGKPTEGKAISISASEFKVKSDSGETTVEVTKDTQFELGMEGQGSSVKDLKEGSFVMVYGTKLESGVLVAKEVMIHSGAADTSTEHHEHGTKSH